MLVFLGRFRNPLPNQRRNRAAVEGAQKGGLLHEARKLHATALVYVSGIATSAPSTAYAVPLPRIARGRLGLWHISFPRQSGGSGERSEPIGAFMNSPPFFVFLVRRAAQTTPEVACEILLQCGNILFVR